MFFVGQVVINNVDILLVKHFYPPEQAGLYAAIAVVGRVVYMSSWAVVSSMFPLSAGVEHPEPYRRTVVITPLLLVLSISVLSLVGLRLLPNVVWRGLFGASFPSLGAQNGYSSLPLLYVAATSLYCLSVVLITYEMSRKIAKHRLAATGLQRRHRGGHLLVPRQPAPGHHGAVGADAVAAGLRLGPFASLGIRRIGGEVRTKCCANPETASS